MLTFAVICQGIVEGKEAPRECRYYSKGLENARNERGFWNDGPLPNDMLSVYSAGYNAGAALRAAGH